ncbi:MAG: winged helix-turn-helix transcriptional regulator [Epulopiscium sp.]|nr:winged helix-turn-helix transcriptional regulator [Candidatus Epulonipiscium sp.]
MLHIKSLEEGLDIFKALASDIRISIIKLLLSTNELNMNELAAQLNITNGALTGHIKKLENCGLISISNESTGHGNQKKYMVHLDKILIEINSKEDEQNVYETNIKVGHYSDYHVFPTCGLATSRSIIGEVDDPRYFSHPDRFQSDILWFTKGYVEYLIPNFLPASQKIDQITISLELGSEAPGYNDTWPSDIHFYINNKWIGYWTSPGDFGGTKGIFTPDWWEINWNQYGLLKLIVINRKGTFIDGLKISDVSLNDFDLDYRSTIKFKLAVPEDAKHVGGLTIFGKSFGNYNQDINVRIHYSPYEDTTIPSASSSTDNSL